MPRSFQIRTRWRFGLLALVLMAPFFVVGSNADAQKRRPSQPGASSSTQNAAEQQKKNLTRVNTSETPEGSSITIFSDLPLNDYSAYRGGDRFYVLIPGADASRIVSGLRGRGFADVRAQKRGNDVLVSFKLLSGATARVSQKFNRLEILISVPALVAANVAANSGNPNTIAGAQTDAGGSTSGTGGRASGTRGRSGRGTSSRGGSSAFSSPGTDESSSTDESATSSDPTSTNPPDGIPVGPDGQVIKTDSPGFSSDVQPSPMVAPSSAPPSDQIAQLQPTPGMPGSSTELPPVTTTAPTGGTTFGAQVRQNWLFVLLAIVVAGLIAWVVFARSREDSSPAEKRIESVRESKATTAVVAAPTKAKVVSRVEPVPSAEPVKPLKPAEADEPTEKESDAEGIDAKDLIVPAVASAVIAGAIADEPEREEIEAKEIEPVKPVAVELASENVTGLLNGSHYDEAVIATEHPEARQMIAAELLAALAGRNLVRHERARYAFIKHGYFDDATRTLRTAESPAERASAARSLGLVRDDSGTPHLVAALEDSSPEVRRAAVESLAEVRDPAAVAPLEALRDREKNRKVPVALIQHAIEASVVGRMKVEPTTPLATVEPLPPIEPVVSPDVSVEELVTEALPISDVDSPVQPDLISEPVAPIEEESPLLLDDAAEAPAVSDIPADVTEELAVEATEPVLDISGDDAGEWVDVDVSRGAESSTKSAPPVVPVQPVEEVVVEETSAAEVISDPPAEVGQAESEPEADASDAVIPIVATGAVIAGAGLVTDAPTEDERGLDVAPEPEKELAVAWESDKQIDAVGAEHGAVSDDVLKRLASEDVAERSAAVEELGSIGGEDAFREISTAFDDPSPDVRDAAARALFMLNPDRAASFTRALREASPERRRHIGGALSSSGLATEAIGHLMGESRETTYDAFSLLFLMAKAGEVQPLMRAVEEHPNSEVRLAVVKLLALSGQQEILPAFRRLAVRGSLPTEVRSAVMEAIYQISSQSPGGSG